MNKQKVGLSRGFQSSYFLHRVLIASTIIGLGAISTARATADFSGHWLASTGTVTSTIGSLSSTCTKIEIRIQQTASEIRTELYEAECKTIGTKWGPIVQTIRGGKVVEIDSDGDEEEVGTISDDTLITVSRGGSTQYAYNLKLLVGADGSKKLQSYYGTKGMMGAIVTEGIHGLVP